MSAKMVGNLSSKYSLNPEQFEDDVKRHNKEHEEKQEKISKELNQLINLDTYQEENFHMVIQQLISIKKEMGF